MPGATPARELLVRTALHYLNNLSKDAADDKTLQWQLGQAYEQIGDVQGDSSGPNLGQFREALSSYTKALSLIEPIAADRRDYEALSCSAWLHFKCGDLQLRISGPAPAIESYSQGIKVAGVIATALRDTRADDVLMNGYMRLATAKGRTTSLKEALASAKLAEEAANRATKHHRKEGQLNFAQTRLLVGNLLWLEGDLQGASARYTEAITLVEQLLGEDTDSTTYLEVLADAYRHLGDLQGNAAYFNFGDNEKASFYQAKALKIAQQLADRDPNDALARSHLSIALRHMGAAQRDREPARAIESYRKALGVLQSLMTDNPGDLNYQRDLANTHLGLSSSLRNAGKLKQALDEVTIALSVQRKMLKRSPERYAVREDMFDALLTEGKIRLGMREPVSALDSLTQAFSNAQQLVGRKARNLYAERCLAMSYSGMAEYHAFLSARGPKAERSKHKVESVAYWDKSLAIWSNWRERNLATPFAANREKEVLRARASVLPREP